MCTAAWTPNSATPPHSHDTEEVVLFLKGSGRATVADREVRYQSGDTLILPAAQVHQVFAETDPRPSAR